MLTERQLLILQVIIDDFIQSAQPVGSRAISKKDEVTYSSATIRNEMADLEEMGFLQKTHSSSGRIPSEKGYRFYVDHLMAPFRLSDRDLETIQDTFNDHLMEYEKVVQKSAEVLSELTNYTSIILGPEVYETRLKQLQIIPLSSHSAVAILVTNTGHVQHRSFSIPVDIDPADLETTVNLLNERLHGVSLLELNEKMQTEVLDLLKKHTRNYKNAYEYIKAALLDDQHAQLYVSGKTNIMSQPEFKDIDKIRSLLSVIEQEHQIAPILRKNADGIQVSIGRENELEAMRDCSLITATYSVGNEQMGTIALLGPTRMEYSKVISLLNVLSGHMNKTFRTWYEIDEYRK
ncbi:heat-inducible transcription repressor HrcA [Melghiribacillus thermohalophilus]|uniref:Heat-inducible transcription repressor HrcA n=1 Tax=Melghiribacillus thermohalophilus TaxID=1324956 RepID=A0A4R3NC39_9BACI|nr:heat-inducible transcriptional repressor HrcA [Melghiribacillus thermohalophilus]TCT27034.1 heat-inducible transcription repressor HrcA [Melghiribacillus thermohalophilus]